MFDNLDKQVVPDPLTGGTQTIYTNKEGTFMMCIPDRAIPRPMAGHSLPDPIITPISYDSDGKLRVWTWELPSGDTITNLSDQMEYRGPSSHCKACEDEAAGIKHIQAQKHTCRKIKQ